MVHFRAILAAPHCQVAINSLFGAFIAAVRQRDLRHRETYRFDAFQPEKAIIAVRAYAFVLPAESSAGVVLGTQAHHCAGADPSGRIPCHWTHLHFGREKLTVIQAENSKAQEVRSSTISLTIA
jgi:hypothetical protein